MDNRNLSQKNAESAAIPFPEELEHLDSILALLRTAVEEAEAGTELHDKEYMESKRYMADNRNEIDPKEIFQVELLLRDIERAGMFALKEQDRHKKLLESPYFSRIDFCGKNSTQEKQYYIGKFSFSQNRKIIIYDWRAPVSSMFYDCELGNAGYDAPIGRINGELTRKRQFKIKNSCMEYALESSMQIQDDVLQRELSNTSDEKMKTIISTLQGEQNIIIRNETAKAMIIQGVAGSGKTSIALHRVAYLLYRFKKTLSAQNVVILSPNKVFGDFIANVLPELGEDPIFEMSFVDIADAQLIGILNCEPDRDPLETNDLAWCERVQFKSTLKFAEQLEKFLSESIDKIFEPSEYSFGHFSVSADWIRERYQAYKRYPLLQRINEIAGDIYDRFIDRNIRSEELPKRRGILKQVRSMLKIKNSLALYKEFYKTIDRENLLVMPTKDTLEWADVYPFLYTHALFSGLKKNQIIKHVVIDEMQDYTPIQYKLINLLFDCKKTILGDFSQCVNPNHLNTLDDMRSVYAGEKIVELNKSYRSSYEIISFAKRISHVSKLEPIERHGSEPELISCWGNANLIEKIHERIEIFKKSENNSLGIILKTPSDAKMLYDKLNKESEITLLTPESDKFVGGITLTSVQMSKGLEFDSVLIPFTDNHTYCTECDRNLLYIACTRAMHELTLLYDSTLTKLIEQ